MGFAGIKSQAAQNGQFPELASGRHDAALTNQPHRALLFDIAIVYGLILLAIWTPKGPINLAAMWGAVFSVVAVTFRRRYSAEVLGLAHPSRGALTIVAYGSLMLVGLMIIARMTSSLGPPQALVWKNAWQYAIWALVQQFILLSVIYVRLESWTGPMRAIIAASSLFAIAHIPSPVLTPLTFVGALFFCEMFRRYRNVFPLGLVHALLGLTIASRFPDSVLHHMRVGIGYLMYHH